MSEQKGFENLPAAYNIRPAVLRLAVEDVNHNALVLEAEAEARKITQPEPVQAQEYTPVSDNVVPFPAETQSNTTPAEPTEVSSPDITAARDLVKGTFGPNEDVDIEDVEELRPAA